jgi:hypothetical protein
MLFTFQQWQNVDRRFENSRSRIAKQDDETCGENFTETFMRKDGVRLRRTTGGAGQRHDTGVKDVLSGYGI